MSSGNIEGAFTAYRYCHKFMNDCPKKDICLRNDRNMLYNWISSVMDNPECSEKNGYPYLLTEVPEKDEIPKNYFGSWGIGMEDEDTEEESSEVRDESSEQTEDKYSEENASLKIVDYLNDIIKHSRVANFYIEPFVGKSTTVQHITGISNILGTDIDADRLKSIMEQMNGTPKTYQVCDYKTWNKALLSDAYKGKCIVYCEPPRQDSDKFKIDEFIEVVKEWAPKNKVFVRYSKLKRRKPVLELGENDFLFWM